MPLKYYFVFVLTVLLLTPFNAFAARAVPGVVPSVVPLFPTPVGVEPNLRGNIQYQGESVFSEKGQTTEQAQSPLTEDAGTGASADLAGAPGSVSPLGGAVWRWGALVVCVLVLGLLTWGWYRKRKTNV